MTMGTNIMRKKNLAALLLALASILLAGCRSMAAPAQEENIAGADWRTWGWIDDSGVITTPEGAQVSLLLCVFPENAVLFYDDDTQTAFADLRYPYAIKDAKQSYASVTLLDWNSDGSADIQLVFSHDDGTQTELVWCWNGEEFAFAPVLSGAAK